MNFTKEEVAQMRAFLAVVAGYLIFALSAVLLFRLSRVDPHAPAAVGFEAFTMVYGLIFASLGGFAAGKIARRRDLNCGIALALVIASGAAISMIARPGAGALWTQTAALLLFAPASVAGDWIGRTKRGAIRRTPM
jgi:hypothetical protein